MKLFEIGNSYVPETSVRRIRAIHSKGEAPTFDVELKTGEVLHGNVVWVRETIQNTTRLEAVVLTDLGAKEDGSRDTIIEYCPILGWALCYRIDDDEDSLNAPLLYQSRASSRSIGVHDPVTGTVETFDGSYPSVDEFVAECCIKRGS
ncbi:MAG: hypothetical protein ACREXR_01265 [Gammaproteobacteria bacterium]